MELNTLAMVHEFLRQHVRPGAFCIDATAGRGRDTALLCRLAGPSGHVLAFDIQQCALDAAAALLASEGLQAELHLDSHAHMGGYAAAGSVDCIVFNFGRLPGGDPQIMTRADSSVAAVKTALELLKPGGVMALAIYYGGANGYDERDALLEALRGTDARRYSVLCCDWRNRGGDPPIAVFVWRERSCARTPRAGKRPRCGSCNSEEAEE